MYDELVKRLKRYVEIERAEGHGADLEAEAADAIEELSKPRWIPVTERLPEEYVGVLCYCSRNGQYGYGEWSKEDNGTIYWTGLYGMIPTHWMPLPEPPKEEAK